MKTIRFIAAMMFFAALSTASIYAQTGTTSPTAGRIAVIDTVQFSDEKEGIAKFTSVLKQLNTEFEPRQKELQNLANQMAAIQKEVEALSKQTGAPVNANTIEQKRIQFEDLQRQAKAKEEDANVAYERRRQTLLGPINSDIQKALEEYRKQKGYTMILDISGILQVSQRAQSNMILAMDDSADVTADFIKFYNTRPAGTATTPASTPSTAAAAPARRTN